MTNRAYIIDKLKPFELGESLFADIEAQGIILDEEYEPTNQMVIMNSIIDCLEELLMRPRVESVNEGGFSLTWRFEDLGKFYLYLCRKYGRKPLKDITSLLGISSITDKTSIW